MHDCGVKYVDLKSKKNLYNDSSRVEAENDVTKLRRPATQKFDRQDGGVGAEVDAVERRTKVGQNEFWQKNSKKLIT